MSDAALALGMMPQTWSLGFTADGQWQLREGSEVVATDGRPTGAFSVSERGDMAAEFIARTIRYQMNQK